MDATSARSHAMTLVASSKATVTPTLKLTQRLAPALRRLRAWALAKHIPGGVRDAEFLALVQRIDPTAMHDAPPIVQFVDGELAFNAVITALNAAHEEVLLETYILRDDRVGERVKQALIAASRRGVRVSVLADAVGSVATAAVFWRSLEADGVTVRLFHRVWRRPFEALIRDHRKIIVIDRFTAFTGGMNIGVEYGSSIHKKNDAFRDTFIRVEGSIARELAAVFAEGWDRAQGPSLPGLEYVSWSTTIVAPHEHGLRRLGARAWRARIARRLARREDRRRGRRVLRELTATEVRERTLLVLDPRPGRGQREMIAVLAALLGGARKHVWITTPYFAPPTRAIRLLVAAACRGVDVRLMLPGPRADVSLARHAAHGAYTRLLASGVRIFEYEAATLHAKTMVVDGYASLIGSSNLDFRSLWLNAECNLLIFDTVYGQVLEDTFAADVQTSVEITGAEWQKRTLRHRMWDRFARSVRWAL